MSWSSPTDIDIVVKINDNHNLIQTYTMILETQELGEIFAAIEAEFLNDPAIKVIPIAGDPPNKYEVTYHIPCTVQDEQGNVTVDSNHTVIISIPFGFPHFPPSCKPKSSIFHPDFDDAAICLGDFWDGEQNIPQLIRHLADMLSGKVYSTNNAFNEKAAAWFRSNQARLPFTKNTTGPAEKPAEPLSLSLEYSDDDAEISILEDDDFADDVVFPGELADIQDDTPTQKTPSGPATPVFDPGWLKQLAKQKNFIKLDQELKKLSSDIDFQDRQQLSRKTASALKEANTLYEQAEEFTAQGNSHKGLECFKAVESRVADFPNIRNDIRLAEQSSELLSDLSPPALPPHARHTTQKDTQEPPSDTSVLRRFLQSRKKPQGKTKKARLFDEKNQRPTNVIPFVLTGGLLCIVGTLTYFYFSLSSTLMEAKLLFSECTTSLTEKNFQSAEKACTAALDTTKGIFIIHQTEVSELQSNIRKILNSEEMRQGLLGNVLYNQKYVSKSTLAAHQSLRQFKSEGDTYLQESAWDQAAASFQKALELGRRLNDILPDEFMDIEHKLKYSVFRSMLTLAEGNLEKENWEEAAAALRDLQQQLHTLEPDQQVEYQKYIGTLLAKTQFTTLKEQADTLFSQSDWVGAASLFQKAVEAGRALSLTDPQELASLKENITKAELYSTINAGNRAFSSGQWNTAIKEYKNARTILEKNAEILNIGEVETSRNKLERIILQSAIIRDRQVAEKKRESGDRIAASDSLQKVIKTIETSVFDNDPEFKDILAETQQAQQILKDEMFIEEKKQYLIQDYVSLFLKNYPAATPQTLSAPVATFEKKLGRQYIFKLQCTESGRGRPLKLIMYYAYNPDNDKWKFHSEN
jgi:tetratricopeptide (TPR) repeat protein